MTEVFTVTIFSVCVLGLIYNIAALFASDGWLGKRAQLSIGHNYKFSREMDKVAQETLDGYLKGEINIEEKDCYTIKFSNGVIFWVANKYFAYGNIYKIKGKEVTDKHRISVDNALRLIKIENAI